MIPHSTVVVVISQITKYFNSLTIYNHKLEKYEWQKPHQSNPTGSDKAYYPNKDKKDAINKKYKTWKSD